MVTSNVVEKKVNEPEPGQRHTADTAGRSIYYHGKQGMPVMNWDNNGKFHAVNGQTVIDFKGKPFITDKNGYTHWAPSEENEKYIDFLHKNKKKYGGVKKIFKK